MAAAMIIGKILGAVGGTLGAVGQYRSDIAASHQMAFDAQQAANNAELARQDIILRGEAAQVERANIAKGEKIARGEARVGYASGNVQLDTGSALQVEQELAEQSAREKQASREQEALDKQRLETERQGLLAESRLKRKAARSAKKTGQIGMVGGVLSAIGGTMGK